MPYTPPTSQSPATSRPETPSLSRSHSYSKSQQQYGMPHGHTARPDLPRSSSSYLHKHRRSPSVSSLTSTVSDPASPCGDLVHPELPKHQIEQEQQLVKATHRQPSAVRPIVTNGLVFSPPESSQNSSDDELNSQRGRVRELKNLAELQAAIRIIEQHRVSSPDRTGEETKKARITLGLDRPLTPISLKDFFAKPEASPLPLSVEARKISHSRSCTDSSPFLDMSLPKRKSPPSSNSAIDMDDDDDDLGTRPVMVRKKSGELVRPALRPASAKRRPSSMPGTPTYSKAVHFDSRLEHVRHFLQVDRPLAVSAGSSPVDSSFEDELEFPFSNDDTRSKSPPFEWEIRLTNFPADSMERQAMPVRVERVYLSSDNKNLIGAVAARNIAFHKFVVARFTLDYWKTTSEVVADYSPDVRRQLTSDGYDRFLFSIKLEDQANLENKTMFFCVRYNVNGQEFWDNNKSINYQVDFSKQAKPQKGRQGMQGNSARSLNALPRSKPAPTFSSRPRCITGCPDDFTSGSSSCEFFSFPQPSTAVGDSPIRFTNVKAANDNVSGVPSRRISPAGQAFGNRYDFGASLSATTSAAGTNAGDRGGFHSMEDAKTIPTKQTSFAPKPMSFATRPTIASVAKTTGQPNGGASPRDEADKAAGAPGATKAAFQESGKPTALTAGKPSVQSSSYHELLDKYCFFGSGKPSTHHLKSSQVDGVSDEGPKKEKAAVKSPVPSDPASSQPTSPHAEERNSSSTITSPRMSRSASPATGSGLGSRTTSPVSFGYPYRQTMQNGLFAETHTPTAIRG